MAAKLLFACFLGCSFLVHSLQVVTLSSGVSASVDWVASGETISVTATINSIDFGWMAFGVSSNSGLGKSLLIGGGALVVQRLTPSSPFLIREFKIEEAEKYSPYSTLGLAAEDALDCISTFCQSESQACFTQKLCRDSLKCANTQYALLPENITAQNLEEVGTVFQPCITPLSDPKQEDQAKALSLMLSAGACFAKSCSSKLLEINTRTSSLVSSSFSQTSTSSVLQFSLSQFHLGGVSFSRNPTFFVLTGSAFSTGKPVTEKTPLPVSSGMAALTVNVDTGLIQRAPVPTWLLVHVALSVLGLGFFFPLSLFLHQLTLKYSWIPFLVCIVGIAIAALGSIVVSSLGERSSPSDMHKIISILAILFTLVIFLASIFQPTPSALKNPADSAWKHVLSKRQIGGGGVVRPPSNFWWTVFKLGSLLGVCVAAFTGYQTVVLSSVEASELLFAAIVCTALCLFFAALMVLGSMCVFCRRTRTVGKLENFPITNSENPVFAKEAEEGEIDVELVLPMVLAWNNLDFSVPSRNGKAGKQVFRNAVGVCSPRTLTAVLGPSGAGKSSLMDFLACRNRVPANESSVLTVNGTPIENFPQLHRHLAYVPQNDILHEHLTVLETLQFTCEMILPSSWSDQAKVDTMLRMVAQLSLGHVLDTLVGGQDVRGLSGGERRRVSIALQMIKSPSILFLDEPTSGLDAHLALKLCKVLRELANEGRTLIATVHQPSVACFELFDRCIVLSAGHTVYSGTRTNLMLFLKQIHHDVPASNWNPADWVLTLVDIKRFAEGEEEEDDQERIVTVNGKNGEYRLNKRAEQVLKRNNIRSLERQQVMTSPSLLTADVALLRDAVLAYYRQVNPAKLEEDMGVVEEVVNFALAKGVDAVDSKMRSRYNISFLPFLKLNTSTSAPSVQPLSKEELLKAVAFFYQSSFYSELSKRIDRAGVDVRVSLAKYQANGSKQQQQQPTDEEDPTSAEYSQNFMIQVKLLARRSFLLVWRNPQALRFQAFQNVLFGLMLGALYSNIKFINSPFQLAFSMASILAMVAFVALSLGTQVAYNERLVLEREMSDALYSPFAHFTCRIVVGLPVSSFVALCLIVPAYFWIGYKLEGDAFLFFLLVNVALVFLFDSVVFVLTLVSNNINSAYAMGNFYEAITIFFSGVFIPVYAMPDFLRWLYFFSPFAFAFGAVVENEFAGTENAFVIKTSGVIIENAWANLLVVFAMGVGWRFLGLIGIVRLFNQKRPGRGGKSRQPESRVWCCRG